jgi:hypothetical protein
MQIETRQSTQVRGRRKGNDGISARDETAPEAQDRKSEREAEGAT